MIARTQALPNMFYSWPQQPHCLCTGERLSVLVLAAALRNTHRAHSDSSLLVWHHLHPLDRKFQNWLGSPQHHRSVCKAPGVTMTLTTVWVFYGMYGKVGKSHTVKYEQPLCFMVTLLLFVTLGSVDKKNLSYYKQASPLHSDHCLCEIFY